MKLIERLAEKYDEDYCMGEIKVKSSPYAAAYEAGFLKAREMAADCAVWIIGESVFNTFIKLGEEEVESDPVSGAV